MSWVAVGVTVGGAIVKGVGAHRAKKKAGEANKKSEKEINKQKREQSKELSKGYAAQVQAEKDIENVYEGMTSISPEAQYDRNESERATASAIDKATRTGSSTGEIMNLVSGLTSQGQRRGQRISAQEQSRRKAAMVAAKTHAAKAAATGLAGKEAQIALQNEAYEMVAQKQAQNNATAAQNYQFFSDIVNDISGAAVMAGSAIGGGEGDGSVDIPMYNVGGKKKSAGNPYNL